MYQKHSKTSREAWESLDVNSDAAERIYKRIEEAGLSGICAPRIASELNMVPGTVAARVIGLERDQRIVKLYRTEKSPSNRPANVIIAGKFRREALDAGEKILVTKPEEHYGAAPVEDKEAKEILEEVENLIALGSPILYSSQLHKKIRSYLNK